MSEDPEEEAKRDEADEREEMRSEAEPAGEERPSEETPAESHDAEDSDPFAELDEAEDDSDPFAELDDAPLGERTPATDDDLFEEMDREELADEDAVVESVLEGEEPSDQSSDDAIDGRATAAAEGSEVADSGRDEVVVPKRRYCEGCQYFSSPPETACEHPGTDILELVDADHFRVADCPVVEWRRDLEAYPDPSEARTDPRQ